MKIRTCPRFTKAVSALAIATSLAIGGSLSTLPTYAADSTVTAVPPRVELSALPGQSITTELKINNGYDVLQYFAVDISDFIVSDNIGTPIPVSEDVSGRWSLKSWITAPELIPVEAKGTQLVKITINVPNDALPGGHYAMITYQPNADAKPEDLRKTGSLIAHRTGSLIYVTVKGDISENAIIKRFSVPEFNEYGPVNFAGLVENNSDVHVTPQGNITIKDMFGNVVAKLPIEVGNVFPDTAREFASSWNQKWGYGRYQATLDLTYGAAGAVITSSLLFWLFPIRMVIYMLTFFTSILLLIVLLRHKNKRHEQQLEAEVIELKRELEQLEKQK